MAILNRRGYEADFDPDKLLPGEFAVSTDKKYIRMCFSAGVVVRMATYEAFEADMEQMRDILSTCRTIEEVVQRIGSEVNSNAEIVIENTVKAKEYMEAARLYSENASAVTGVHIATKDTAGLMKGGENAVDEDGTLVLTRKVAGESFTANDSVAGPLAMRQLYGKSSQKTLSGKNLFDKSKVQNATETETGFSFTWTGDHGGPIAIGKLKDLAPSLKVGDRVTHYGAVVNSSMGDMPFFYLHGSGTNWISGHFVTITENDLNGELLAYGIPNQVCEYNDVIITKEENASYEPYCGGIPSPNPEYPQPIVSVGQKRAEGYQLLNLNNLMSINYGSVLDSASGKIQMNLDNFYYTTIDIDYLNDYILANQDVPYTFSVDDTHGYYLNLVIFGTRSNGSTYQEVCVRNASVKAVTIIPTGFTSIDHINFRIGPVDTRVTDTTTVISGISLVAGDKALPYEPYTGGVPAAYDVGIEHKTTGKNLFNINGDVDVKGDTLEKTEFNTVSDGILTANSNVSQRHSSGQLISGLKDKTITVSAYVLSIGTGDKAHVAIYDDGVRVVGEYCLVGETVIEAYTCASDSIVIAFGTSAGAGAQFTNIQVEIGDEATEYEPYHPEQTLTLDRTLPAIPVTDAALANYTDETGQMWCCDEIDFERGVYVKRINKVTLDGDESWYQYYSGNDNESSCFYTIITDCLPKGSTSLCNRYTNFPAAWAIEYNNKYGIYADHNSLPNKYFRAPANVITSDDWKTWLASNPVELVYILATPIETPLTDDEIIAAHSLKTYDGVTHISTDNNPAPMIEVEYGTSKVGALSLENSNLHVVNKKLNEVALKFADGLKVPSVGTDGYLPYVGGGSYISQDAEQKGILKVKLPPNATYTMIKFVVSLYNYLDNGSVDYVVSGYTYPPSKIWSYCTAVALGHTINDVANRPVRFGHDGEAFCVYIGAPNSTYSYPQVQIKDVQLGYDAYQHDIWCDGWNIEFISELDDVSERDVTIQSTNLLSGHLPLTGGALTGGLQVPSVGSAYYFPYVRGGTYRSTNGNLTGFLKIKLPHTWIDTMLKFTVSIFNYQENTSVDYIISGYLYKNGANSTWTRVTAVANGHPVYTIANLPVIFGHDGDTCCVYIGTSTFTWYYPQVQVKDVLNGFASNVGNWGEGWDIGIISESDNTVTEVKIDNPNPIASAFTVSGDTLILNWL